MEAVFQSAETEPGIHFVLGCVVWFFSECEIRFGRFFFIY